MADSWIPVYLPDQTVMGKAHVEVQGSLTTITINSDSALSTLIQESLVGLAVVYIGREAVEEVLNKENETDGR